MIRRTLFVLAVRDLDRSAAFYRDVLGFDVREMGDPGWRMYVRDECRIMAGECRDAIPPAELGDHSYFAYALATEPWGMREFGLRTIDGHRIMIGQDLKPVS